MYCNILLELTETVEADVCVWFDCIFPGCHATYMDPPEPPEFEVTDIEINVLYGSNWEKTGRELVDADWHELVCEKAREALEPYDELYEHQLDAYHSERY